ncbi:antagonist of KipI [Bacillus ectoiniformans]|nr:antagonist of KipI [Bacillus ectoiniformans]
MTITRPGLYSTVQDRGRIGYRQYGVVVSGAMDDVSHRIANWLVLNDGGAATVEMTMTGISAVFEEDTFVAFTGADAKIQADGKEIPMWRPVFLPAQCEIHVKQMKQGSRVYMAVAGGIDVPVVLESRSTFQRGGFGGFNGRILAKGDELEIGESNKTVQSVTDSLSSEHPKVMGTNWGVAYGVYSCLNSDSIRCIKGSEYEFFDQAAKDSFFNKPYQITPKSDRMGFRLEGSELTLQEAKEMISEAVAFGTVQVPSDGQPIILMADRQTTGGYPKIANVIGADLSCLAQKLPGNTITFKEVSLAEAHRIYRDREHELKTLRNSIELKWRKEMKK